MAGVARGVVTWLVTSFPNLSPEGKPEMEARHEMNLEDGRVAARRIIRMRVARDLHKRMDAVIAGHAELEELRRPSRLAHQP